MRQNFFEVIKDLQRDLNRNEDSQKNVDEEIKCPHVKIKCGGESIWALVDSGSQVTCVSKDFCDRLLKRKLILELPVSNLIVSTAIGKRQRP